MKPKYRPYGAKGLSFCAFFQKGEIQAMQARMQESHVQHMSEVNHYRGQLEAKAKQTNDSIGQIQNLKEENKILQDAISKAQ